MTIQNQTLLIIKPDIVKKNLIGEIINILEKENIKIKNIKMFKLNKNNAQIFYDEHKNKKFYNELVDFMISGSIVALILEGTNIIIKTRKLIGNTDFKKAENGTIRKNFATSLTKNAVHASDSYESFKKEKIIIF